MIRLLLFFLGVIHKIFQAHLGDSYPSMPLAGEVVRKSYLCLHAARGYRVKLQHQGYTARHTTDNIYIYIIIYHEKSQLNRLVWGSLTLAPIRKIPLLNSLVWGSLTLAPITSLVNPEQGEATRCRLCKHSG